MITIDVGTSSDPLRDLVTMQEKLKPADYPVMILDQGEEEVLCADADELDGYIEGWIMGEEYPLEA